MLCCAADREEKERALREQREYRLGEPRRRQQERLAEFIANAADRLDQLKQLGELKASGVLTDAEFEAEKARILAG